MYASIADGVGIKSTVGRLRKSIEGEVQNIYIGPVNYIDYQIDHISENNLLNPFLL